MICPQCGNTIPEQDQFCMTCGFRKETANIPEPAPFEPTAPEAVQPPVKKRSVAMTVLAVCLAVLVLASGALNVVQLLQSNEHQAQITELTDEVTLLEGSVARLESDVALKDQSLGEYQALTNEQQTALTEYESLLWFYERYVVVVADDGSNLYHTYGCEHFNDDYFWAFNLEAAVQKGYTACPYCQ